jgi:hypothetical protein
VLATYDLQIGLDISEHNKYISNIAIGTRAHRRPPVEAPARDDPFEKIRGGAGRGLRGGARYGELIVRCRAAGLLGGTDSPVLVDNIEILPFSGLAVDQLKNLTRHDSSPKFLGQALWRDGKTFG